MFNIHYLKIISQMSTKYQNEYQYKQYWDRSQSGSSYWQRSKVIWNKSIVYLNLDIRYFLPSIWKSWMEFEESNWAFVLLISASIALLDTFRLKRLGLSSRWSSFWRTTWSSSTLNILLSWVTSVVADGRTLTGLIMNCLVTNWQCVGTKYNMYCLFSWV